MDFSLNDDHLALREAVRRFCDGEYPLHKRGDVETADEAARRHAGMAELGLLGLLLGAEHGGSAQGPVEMMLVAQELGRALANGTWLSNVVLAGEILNEAGSASQRLQWLPAIARGDVQACLACYETQARYDVFDVSTSACRDAEGWQLDGAKSLVLGLESAQLLLVVARTGEGRSDPAGLTLFALDAGTPGLTIKPFNLLDGRRAAHLDLRGVRADVGNVVGAIGGASPIVERALARANAALCAEAAGALDALLEITSEHLRTRKQFGAPLAKFQALQHVVADMAISAEQLKSMACVAAMALASTTDTERERLVAAAKTLTAQLGRRCALAAIQLHGAMGMTDECRASHYAKRLVAIGQLFGDASVSLRRFVRHSAAQVRA